MPKRKNGEIAAKIVVGIYRIGNYIYYNLKVPVIRQISYFVYKVIDFIFSKIMFNTEIPAEAKIGKGLIISHPYGIIIGTGCIIGDNANLRQQITIGNKGGGGIANDGVPIIGDNINIGAGAKIIGPIELGNNVLVGANAVVTKDFGDNVVIAGIPAKIIKSLQ